MKFIYNIKSITRIAVLELNKMFYSPIAWVLLIVFAFQVGLGFAERFDSRLKALELYDQLSALSYIFTSPLNGLFINVLDYLYLYIPLISMGLMSREYSTGSIRLLYSSPISNASIILGKFVAMVLYGLALIAIVVTYVVFYGCLVENFEWEWVFTGVLGMFLLLTTYASIGLFFSTITSYQVVAAIATLSLLSVLNHIGGVGQSVDFVRELTYWLSLNGKVEVFISGVLSSEHIIYFLTITALFITLSIFKLASNREKSNIINSSVKYATLFVIIISISYISSNPKFKLYNDTTHQKYNTLTVESQNVINRIDGKLKITTYTNILDNYMAFGIPANRNKDKELFDKYLQQKKDIEMDYVLYYDTVYNNPNLFRQYNGLSLDSIAKTVAKINKVSWNKVLSPKDIKNIEDLSGPKDGFMRVYRHEDIAVKSTLFGDMRKHPGEKEITALLSHFVDGLTKIAFVCGHGDRDPFFRSDRSYSNFLANKKGRNSLVNNGFDVSNINLLDQDISNDISLLIISDLKTELSEVELSKIKYFIDRGGNLFILGDKNRQEHMNKLMAYANLGVSFGDMSITEIKDGVRSEDLALQATDEACKKFPYLGLARTNNMYLSSNSAISLTYNEAEGKGFKVTPLFKSDNDNSVMIAMEREIDNKSQRIVVSGDADWISNIGLSEQKTFLKSNEGVIVTLFRWFSYNKHPISTYRSQSKDNVLKMPKGIRQITKVFATSTLAVLLLACGLMLILSRKRK